MAESEKLIEIVDKLEVLSIKELYELVKMIEERFGVSLKDMMVSASAAGAGGAGAAAEEKSEYTLHLAEVGASKMNIIKLVKEVAGLGLKEAKEKVDGAPSVIKENVPEAEAKEIKKKFEEAGAKLELK